MWIEKLNLKKFGKFKGSDISFSPKLNLILGNNEGGKTTITHAINAIYNGFFPANHNYRYIPFDDAEANLGMQLSLGEKSYHIERQLLKTANAKVSYDSAEERFKNESLDVMIPMGGLTPELLNKKLWYFDHRTLGKKLDFGKWESWKQLATSLYLENEKFSFADIELRLQDRISKIYTNNSNSKSEIAKCEMELKEVEDRMRELQAQEEGMQDIYQELDGFVQKKEELVQNISKIKKTIEDLKSMHEYKQKLLQFQTLSDEWSAGNYESLLESEVIEEYENHLFLNQRNALGKDAKLEQKRDLIAQRERMDASFSNESAAYQNLSENRKKRRLAEQEQESELYLAKNSQILFFVFLGIFVALLLLKVLHILNITKFLSGSWLFNILMVIFLVLTGLAAFGKNTFTAKAGQYETEVLILNEEISKQESEIIDGRRQIEELNFRIRNLESELKEEEKGENGELSILQRKVVELFGTSEVQECKEKLEYARNLHHRLDLYRTDLESLYEKMRTYELSDFNNLSFDRGREYFDAQLLQMDLQAFASEYEVREREQNEMIFGISKRIGGYESKLNDLECVKLPSYEMNRQILKEKIKKLKEEHSVLIFLKEIFNQIKILSYQNNRPDFEICFNKYFEEFLSEKKFDVRINSQTELNVSRVDLIENLDIDQISTGTLAQIYFLFKLSILEKIDPNATIPMVIDGAFDHYDPYRIKSMMRILERISSQRQVILLSSTPIPDFKGQVIEISD